MKKVFNNPFFANYKVLDLHGETKNGIKALVNNFINEALLLKEKNILIVHGIGRGILRKELHNLLKENKKVKEYKLDTNNLGMTIIKLGDKND